MAWVPWPKPLKVSFVSTLTNSLCSTTSLLTRCFDHDSTIKCLITRKVRRLFVALLNFVCFMHAQHVHDNFLMMIVSVCVTFCPANYQQTFVQVRQRPSKLECQSQCPTQDVQAALTVSLAPSFYQRVLIWNFHSLPHPTARLSSSLQDVVTSIPQLKGKADLASWNIVTKHPLGTSAQHTWTSCCCAELPPCACKAVDISFAVLPSLEAGSTGSVPKQQPFIWHGSVQSRLSKACHACKETLFL